jgi:serine/threonine-protein kinase
MEFRRRMPPLRDWGVSLPSLDKRSARRWALLGAGALIAGYLTAYLLLFPAPILGGSHVVPRVLGLTIPEATHQLQVAEMSIRDSGSDTHPTAPAGTIIWQDPPPGVAANSGLRVTVITSGGPPRIAVPDVTGLDLALAQRIVTAGGLTVARTDSVQAPKTLPGVVVVTRPPAGSVEPPGFGVVLVVNRGAPTIPVPDVVGLTLTDARTKLEEAGLTLGSVTRRRTSDANPGTVIAQLPAAQTLAPPGLLVDVVVARSPQ